MAQQDYQAALDWYVKARNLFPQYPDPYFHIGEIFILKGDYAQAQQNLQKALAIDPTNPLSMHLLALVNHHTGNPTLAEEWMLNAINHQSAPQVLASWWAELGDGRRERYH